MKPKILVCLFVLVFVLSVLLAQDKTKPVPQDDWKGWSCVFSNGVDHPVAVAKEVDGKVVTWAVMGTNTVRELMAGGEVCKISGHSWHDGRPGEGQGSYFADYHPNTNFRTCRICGTCQTQNTSWK